MTEIPADRPKYRIERRYQHKKGSKPLKGFALDITMRFNKDGSPFLQDHNGTTMPFNTLDQLKAFVADEIDRNHAEHYKGAP